MGRVVSTPKPVELLTFLSVVEMIREHLGVVNSKPVVRKSDRFVGQRNRRELHGVPDTSVKVKT